jgi:hypothetical protein
VESVKARTNRGEPLTYTHTRARLGEWAAWPRTCGRVSAADAISGLAMRSTLSGIAGMRQGPGKATMLRRPGVRGNRAA